MSDCKCEPWQVCPTCKLSMFDKSGDRLSAGHQPTKFSPTEWDKLSDEGWKLVRIPAHLDGLAQRGDGTWIGQSPIMGYIGQALDEPNVPVVQLPDGKVRKCYCLYMVPPRSVLRYRRYITTACYGGLPTVLCLNESNTLHEPEKEKGFARWIDNDWLEEVL